MSASGGQFSRDFQGVGSSERSESAVALACGAGSALAPHTWLTEAQDCLADALAAGEEVMLRINGVCMEPLLFNGERVRVVGRRLPVPGDVVAVRRAGGMAQMHRLLGYVWWKGRWRVMTMADSADRPDSLADLGQVLGTVVAREGRPHRVTLRLRAGAVASWVHWTVRLAFRRHA